MNNLINLANKYIEIIQNENPKDTELDNIYSELISTSLKSNSNDVEMMMKHLINSCLGLKYCHIPVQTCGVLIECGFNANCIFDEFIAFYKNCLIKYIKFQNILNEQKDKLFNYEDLDEDEDHEDIENELIEVYEKLYPDEFNAYDQIEKYYLTAVSIISSDYKLLEKSKIELSLVFEIESEGCFWLSKLLSVLIDKPLLVIELNENKGFIGKMSGIVDNFQLQALLMGNSYLNDSKINEEFLNINLGIGPQNIDNIEVPYSKWFMFNWNNFKKESRIWSEGIPDDILDFLEYKVILLDKPTYKSGLSSNRIFKNLKANIEVEKILDKKEVENWIELMKK